MDIILFLRLTTLSVESLFLREWRLSKDNTNVQQVMFEIELMDSNRKNRITVIVTDTYEQFELDKQ